MTYHVTEGLLLLWRLGIHVLLSELQRVVRRRWWVALVGLAFTAGLAVAVTHEVPLRYRVTADVLLLPPAPSDAPRGFNPYLSLEGLSAPVDVLASAMSDEQSQAAIKRLGGQADYTVQRDYATSAPIMVVTAEANLTAEASKTLDLIIDQIPGRLASIQDAARIPTASQISSSIVTRDVRGETVRNPQIRALLAAVVVGLGLTLLLTALVDSLLTARSGRGREPTSDEVSAFSGQEPGVAHASGPPPSDDSAAIDLVISPAGPASPSHAPQTI